MQASTSRPGHPALREGLVFGVTLWIITLPAALLQTFVPTNGLVIILGVLSLLVAIALNLLAGVRASQRTGRVRTGALAGLIMELISSLLGTITSLTTFFLFDTPFHHRLSLATSTQVQQVIIVSSISFVIGFVVELLLGAGIGALGGLIGSRRAQLPMQAEPLYQRALTIQEQALGPDHPDTATSLNNLAALYDTQGKYEQAEPLYQRALAIREKMLGPDHPDTASSLNNLGVLYYSQGKYEQAEPLYQRALAIREKRSGPDHPDTAQSLNNLAALYREQGTYEQAEPLYVRALAIGEQQLGPEYPDTQIILGNYVALLRTMGRDSEARALETKHIPPS